MSIQMSGADVIDLAVQTETRGELFYREAAARTGGGATRELFEYLAGEELRHKQVFSDLGEQVTSEDVQPGILEEAMSYIEATVDMAFFRESYSPLHRIPADATEVQLLEQALAFCRQHLANALPHLPCTGK